MLQELKAAAMCRRRRICSTLRLSTRVNSHIHFYPAAMALVFYVIICKDDKEEWLLDCAIPGRYVTPSKNYIGFRETVGDAVEARQKIWRGVVTDATLVVARAEQSSPRLNLCEDDASRPVGRADVFFVFRNARWKSVYSS